MSTQYINIELRKCIQDKQYNVYHGIDRLYIIKRVPRTNQQWTLFVEGDGVNILDKDQYRNDLFQRLKIKLEQQFENRIRFQYTSSC